jgi:hypothetical protein
MGKGGTDNFLLEYLLMLLNLPGAKTCRVSANNWGMPSTVQEHPSNGARTATENILSAKSASANTGSAGNSL